MGGKTHSNQEPFRPRNQPLQNAGYELIPKEPAAQKPQLPSIGKKKKVARRAQQRWETEAVCAGEG